MVICLERGADLHMAQRIPLPVTVSCFSKIQIGFTFLVSAHPGSPGQRAVKRVCINDICAVVPNAVTVKLFADDAKSYSVSGDTSTPDCLLTCLTAIPTGLTIGN